MRQPTALLGGALAATLALALAAAPALAARPTLAGEATYGVAGGDVLVHYATTGTDAVPATDANANGTPDFVEAVATTAEAALDQYVAFGFRAPLSDTGIGGDARLDIYLRDLVSADGNAGTDGCTGTRCYGYVVAENDYAGFGYPTPLVGIQTVVPHEVFHLVQQAYSNNQPSSWTEGSAVWAVEELFGAANSDFEHFLPAFLTRSFRPFERPIAGFGDSYPYGAALWPYFLAHRFDRNVVVDAWKASESADFLAACDAALRSRGSGLEAAFIDFTRWNLFTGARAAGGRYPDAGAWAQVPREAPITAAGRLFVEGMSARYVPIFVADKPRIALTPPSGFRIAAWLVRDEGGTLASGVELVEQDGVLAATVDAPGGYTLVVTGLTRNTIATAVEVALTPPVEEPPDGEGDDGGCSAAGGRGTGQAALLVLGALAAARRRRNAR
jgi:hypothetical protein